MSKIRNISKALKKINLQWETMVNLINNEETFVNLNRDQMRMGEDGEGSMRDYMSLWYAEDKRERVSYSALYPKIDLYDSGDFQNKMFVKLTGGKWEYWSRDNKTAELVRKEGTAIFDLNPNMMTIARSINEELIADKIKLIIQKA